jgi:Protein of unknown function (DUF1272)
MTDLKVQMTAWKVQNVINQRCRHQAWPENLERQYMLEIRPTCENCGAQLLANSLEAMICSFECH